MGEVLKDIGPVHPSVRLGSEKKVRVITYNGLQVTVSHAEPTKETRGEPNPRVCVH